MVERDQGFFKRQILHLRIPCNAVGIRLLWVTENTLHDGQSYPMTDPWDERYIYPHLPYKSTIHVGEYTIHGSYGYQNPTHCFLCLTLVSVQINF